MSRSPERNPETVTALAVERDMNNRQASIIAAAAFHAGQQASLRDVEQTATSLERVLTLWDTEANEAAALADVRVAVRYEEA